MKSRLRFSEKTMRRQNFMIPKKWWGPKADIAYVLGRVR
jgi:hypothetical protein